jgi:hypothetical protein
MANTIDVNGISADEVYTTIRNAGVADADAKLLVSNWIYQNYLNLYRTFSYVTAFPASMPSCVPDPFVRSFVHKDWVDGEDLVQAEQSPTDDGFNLRFHRIENDLDSLGAKIATLAQCMASMRASLRSMFDEIAAELNRIDSDLGPIKGPIVLQPPPNYAISDVASTLKIANYQYAAQNFAAQLPPGSGVDPMLNYLGSTIYQGKAVSLFNTSQGVMVMPAVDLSTPSTVDVRVGASGALARAFVENAELAQSAAKGITPAALVARFGSLMLSNGQSLQQAVAVLPANTEYKNSQALVADVSARTAGALQSTTGLAKQIATTVSAPAGATTFDAVDISGLQALPPEATAALRQAGIGTIGQLATATSTILARALKGAGSSLTPGEVAAVQGTAQTLSNLRIE